MQFQKVPQVSPRQVINRGSLLRDRLEQISKVQNFKKVQAQESRVTFLSQRSKLILVLISLIVSLSVSITVLVILIIQQKDGFTKSPQAITFSTVNSACTQYVTQKYGLEYYKMKLRVVSAALGGVILLSLLSLIILVLKRRQQLFSCCQSRAQAGNSKPYTLIKSNKQEEQLNQTNIKKSSYLSTKQPLLSKSSSLLKHNYNQSSQLDFTQFPFSPLSFVAFSLTLLFLLVPLAYHLSFFLEWRLCNSFDISEIKVIIFFVLQGSSLLLTLITLAVILYQISKFNQEKQQRKQQYKVLQEQKLIHQSKQKQQQFREDKANGISPNLLKNNSNNKEFPPTSNIVKGTPIPITTKQTNSTNFKQTINEKNNPFKTQNLHKTSSPNTISNHNQFAQKVSNQPNLKSLQQKHPKSSQTPIDTNIHTNKFTQNQRLQENNKFNSNPQPNKLARSNLGSVSNLDNIKQEKQIQNNQFKDHHKVMQNITMQNQAQNPFYNKEFAPKISENQSIYPKNQVFMKDNTNSNYNLEGKTNISGNLPQQIQMVNLQNINSNLTKEFPNGNPIYIKQLNPTNLKLTSEHLQSQQIRLFNHERSSLNQKQAPFQQNFQNPNSLSTFQNHSQMPTQNINIPMQQPLTTSQLKLSRRQLRLSSGVYSIQQSSPFSSFVSNVIAIKTNYKNESQSKRQQSVSKIMYSPMLEDRVDERYVTNRRPNYDPQAAFHQLNQQTQRFDPTDRKILISQEYPSENRRSNLPYRLHSNKQLPFYNENTIYVDRKTVQNRQPHNYSVHNPHHAYDHHQKYQNSYRRPVPQKQQVYDTFMNESGNTQSGEKVFNINSGEQSYRSGSSFYHNSIKRQINNSGHRIWNNPQQQSYSTRKNNQQTQIETPKSKLDYTKLQRMKKEQQKMRRKQRESQERIQAKIDQINFNNYQNQLDKKLIQESIKYINQNNYNSVLDPIIKSNKQLRQNQYPQKWEAFNYANVNQHQQRNHSRDSSNSRKNSVKLKQKREKSKQELFKIQQQQIEKTTQQKEMTQQNISTNKYKEKVLGKRHNSDSKLNPASYEPVLVTPIKSPTYKANIKHKSNSNDKRKYLDLDKKTDVVLLTPSAIRDRKESR